MAADHLNGEILPSPAINLQHKKLVVGAEVSHVRFILVAFTFAFIFYTVAWPHAPILKQDSDDFMDLADRLRHGSLSEPHERVIGYPILLLLTDSTEIPTRMLFGVSLFLHFASVWLYCLVLRRLVGSTVIVPLACAVLLLPPFVESAAYVLSENAAEFTLATAVAALALWFRAQPRWLLIVSGICLALSFLVRPTYALLSFALLPLVILRLIATSEPRATTRLLASTAMFLLPTVVAVGGYHWVNYVKFGYFGLTPKIGFMLFTRTVGFLERIPNDEKEVRDILIAARDRSLLRGSSHTGAQFMWDFGARDLAEATGQSKVELSRRMLRMNLRLIASSPLQYLTAVAESLVTYSLPYVTALASFNSRWLQLLWSLMHFGIVALCGLYAVMAVISEVASFMPTLVGGALSQIRVVDTRRVEERWVAAAMLVSIIYTAVISSAVEVGDPRYAIPVMPMMIVLALLSVWPFRPPARNVFSRASFPRDGLPNDVQQNGTHRPG